MSVLRVAEGTGASARSMSCLSIYGFIMPERERPGGEARILLAVPNVVCTTVALLWLSPSLCWLETSKQYGGPTEC